MFGLCAHAQHVRLFLGQHFFVVLVQVVSSHTIPLAPRGKHLDRDRGTMRVTVRVTVRVRVRDSPRE